MKNKTPDRIPTPITDASWASWPYAGPGMSVHDGRNLERDRHKLLALCEDAQKILGNVSSNDTIKWCKEFSKLKKKLTRHCIMEDPDLTPR